MSWGRVEDFAEGFVFRVAADGAGVDFGVIFAPVVVGKGFPMRRGLRHHLCVAPVGAGLAELEKAPR